MQNSKVITGKEMLDIFFSEIENIEGVDSSLSKKLRELYANGKFSEKNIVNELHELRKTLNTDGN